MRDMRDMRDMNNVVEVIVKLKSILKEIYISWRYNINVGDVVDGDGESGICVGFDDDEVLLYDRGEGWSCKIEDCKVNG
tara:strand:- start:860 stop:1096 length:237 start_codon:yes stop_codon:yes gene_type:complete